MKRKLICAVLSISMITILGSTAISPALAGIKSAFPMYSDDTIQLLLTIPPLFMIPFCFLCGPIAGRIGKKRTLLAGILLYLTGGVGGALAPGFKGLLGARVILGMGCGLITPMAQALISSNFKGSLRERLTAYSGSASYFMGIIASFTVSRIAAVNWRCAFLIYLIAVVVLILNWLYLPDDRGAERERKEGAVGSRKPDANWRGYGLAALMVLVNIAFYAFSTSIALFMKQEGLGNDSTSGYAVALFMIFGFVTGIGVPVLRAAWKEYLPVLGCMMMGGGYAGLCSASSLPVVFISAAFIGGSYSIFYSEIFLRTGSVSRSEEENVRLVTYVTAGIFVGQTVSTYVLKMMEFLLGRQGYRFRFLCLSAGLMVSGAAAAVMAGKARRTETGKAAE